MDVLLTFTGFHDPYAKGLIEHDEQPGPILSLLAARTFDQVFLFDSSRTKKITQETRDAVVNLHRNTKVDVLEINLDDPTDYSEIFRGLRAHIRRLSEQLEGASYYISVASGTPQMHACWVLLAAAGELPAHILHVRPPHFVTKERPLVSEVAVTSREFPVV